MERPYAIIDTTIVREHGRYYSFTKHQSKVAVFQETAEHLMGPWTEVAGFTLANTKGYEGAACFPLASASAGQPDSWCLLLDGKGYQAFVTHDLASGNFVPAPAITFPFKFRHGTVTAVTDEEYRRLETTYPAEAEASSTQ